MRALALVLAASSTTYAEQVVVTDVTYTHGPATTTDSHYRVDPLPGTPTNWVSPVDYTAGTAVVRLEVFTKPTDTPTRFQICFEATPSYACTDQAPAYTDAGVYTWTTPFTRFYQFNQVDWSQGTRRIALILKDTMNGKPAPENVGVDASALYMPTDLRVTVTLVSADAGYVPPDAGIDAGARDAGAPDAGTPDAGTPDAGSPDAGALDAGLTDAGFEDAGVPIQNETPTGVAGGCGAASFAWFSLASLALLRRRAQK